MEWVEGLNTSSEPRESLVNGGIRVVGLSDSSSISQVLVVISFRVSLLYRLEMGWQIRKGTKEEAGRPRRE